MSEVKAIFDGIQKRFDEGLDLGSLTAVYLFEFDGGESKWTIRVEDGKASLAEGEGEGITCTIKMDSSDFISMMNGDSNVQQLFMMGKLKVSGNMGQALKLQKILE